MLSRRAVEPFEVGLTKQLLCEVDPNAGRIGALLIRRVANRQIGKFPFAYCGLKIIPDFQRPHL
jgi:hypothetical protein